MSSNDDATRESDLLLKEADLLTSMIGAGRVLEGEQAARFLLKQHPAWGLGWKLLAACLAMQGKSEEALDAAQIAAQTLVNDSDLFNIMGTIYRQLGQLDSAIAAFYRALEIRPDYAEVHNNLGGALMMQGNQDQALGEFLQAVNLDPAYPEAYQNLGSALQANGRIFEAIGSFLRAAELNSGMLQSLSLACNQMLQCARWVDLNLAIGHLKKNVGRLGYQIPMPFVMTSLPQVNRQEQLQCAQLFAQAEYGGYLNLPPLHRNEPGPRSPLRIGYISADFHAHATSYLLAGVLENHDREKFSVICYSYGPNDGSEIRERIEQACDVFRDIKKHSHLDAAETIAADFIDILIDLKGYTENARPQIAALRPAPVIVNWLGYPGTLGHPHIADYLIGDAIVTPLEHQDEYSETLALMPHCYQPNDRKRVIGAKPSRLDVGLPENGFVFCSFNGTYKITPEVFDVWCRILTEIPDSVLWLLSGNQGGTENLRKEASARGVEEGRLVFAPKLPVADHLGRLQLADLALDTFPYGSHTTGSDALWAGVPLISYCGDTFPSRVAASLLAAVGLQELVVYAFNDYVDMAVSIARTPSKLAKLKQDLRAMRLSAPLFDTVGFTRDFERLLLQIWDQKITGERKSFLVDDAVN